MKNRRLLGIIVLSLILTTFFAGTVYAGIAPGVGECGVVSCKNKCAPGSYFCSGHTCARSGCHNKCAIGYCYCNKHNNVKKEAYSGECGVVSCKNKNVPGSYYCSKHTCARYGCNNKCAIGYSYCNKHNTSTSGSSKYSSTGKKNSSYGSGKKADTYDVHSYKDSTSFADDKWEEFYDYEDDYDDEDEAYDDAEDYWYDNY